MPKLNLRSPLSVVLTFEGLSTAALGSYGCSWNETPTINRLAAEGVVWDRWTSPIDGPCGLIHRWLQTSSVEISRCNERGGALLVTDDPQLIAPDQAFGFGNTLRLIGEIPPKSADTFDQTRLAGTFAAAIDAITPSTQLLWLHSAALRDCWDAPMPLESDEWESAEPYEDDGTGVIASPPQPIVLPEQTDPPELRLDDNDDPDWLFAWMSRYASQVRVLDEILDWLFDCLSDRKPTVLIAGTSGFSLGENGWLGHHVGPLRSNDIRLPMFASYGGPLRVPGLVSAAEFSSVLGRFVARAQLATPSEWCQPNSPFDPAIKTVSERAANAITTSSWFGVEDNCDGAAWRLYVKPDDINDVNDISRLRRDEVDRLNALFNGLS